MEAGTHVELEGLEQSRRVSLGEAARALDVPEAKLRALARAGLLTGAGGPIGPPSFGPEDLEVLRVTRDLVASGVPMARIRRVWASLRRQIAASVPLASLAIAAEGDEVVASDGVARWRPDSGQTLLDFGTEPGDTAAAPAADVPAAPAAAGRADSTTLGEASPPEAAAPLPPPAVFAPPRLAVIHGGTSESRKRELYDRFAAQDSPGFIRSLIETPAQAHAATGRGLSAEEWYQLGSELEVDSPAEARVAYERALALDPELGDAHVNLGRHLHVAGERGKAEPHYREAVRLAPDDPVPHFNLGVLLDETGRKEEAILAYRQAIRRDPDFADAHCNLGLLLESLGRRQDALQHLMTARELAGASE